MEKVDVAEVKERGGSDDMDIDDESEEETGETAALPAVTSPHIKRQQSEDDMEESSEEDDEKESDTEKEAELDDDAKSSSGSSDDSEEERELDMETFDTSELVRGDEDQQYLDSLPEFEREAILAERFDQLKNSQDMKRALREHK